MMDDELKFDETQNCSRMIRAQFSRVSFGMEILREIFFLLLPISIQKSRVSMLIRVDTNKYVSMSISEILPLRS